MTGAPTGPRLLRLARHAAEWCADALLTLAAGFLKLRDVAWRHARHGISGIEARARRAAGAAQGLARAGLAPLLARVDGRRRSGRAGSAPGLMQWIWRESRREQIPILVLIICSLPFYYLVFDLPKHIINGPIQGSGFPTVDATRTLGQLVPPVTPISSLAALEFDRWSALLMLSSLFAALIVVNGAFKLVINTAKGRLGEAMLQRLRADLFARVLAMPTKDAQRLSGAETASIIKDEIEPLGGFIGDAYIMPVLLGAQALTAAAFILLQSVWLGAIAVGIVVVQALIVPRLRRRLIALGRERQLTARELAGRVGEVVEGISDVHINNAVALEKADIGARLERIFRIRYEIYRRKFSIKFLNNMLADVPTLVFFLLGGLLVLKGQLDVGQLVAVIVAYGALPGPVKELIDWDYQRQDMMVRFDQVTLQLPPRPAAEATNMPVPGVAPSRSGGVLPITISGLTIDPENGGERLKGVDLRLAESERVAATGDAGSGASALALALIGETSPSAGSIALAGGWAVTTAGLRGGRIAYVGEDPYVQQASLRAALLYGTGDGVRAATDAERLGEVLELTRLGDEILALALASKFKGSERRDVVALALVARRALAEELSHGDLSRVVVRCHPDRYNDEAPIGENLAITRWPSGSTATWTEHPAVVTVLRRHELERCLEAIGHKMATTAVDLYGGLPRDNILRLTQRLVPPDEIERYAALVVRGESGTARQDADDDQRTLRALALGYIEPRHRLGLVDASMKARIVAARQELLHVIAGEDGRDPALTDAERYDDGMTLEQNIIFGSLVHEAADGERLVRAAVRRKLSELGRLDEILSLGLEFETGRGGRRLSVAQRQKLGLARALLKDAELLIANRPLTALAARTQDAIVRDVLAWLADRDDGAGAGVYWVLAHGASASRFDRVLAFADGRIVDDTRPGSRGAHGQRDLDEGHTR